jgi:hypothetical protein
MDEKLFLIASILVCSFGSFALAFGLLKLAFHVLLMK